MEWKEIQKALGKKATKHLIENVAPGEGVRFVIVGVKDQAIVAMEDRILVIKPGWRASAAFGANVTSIRYEDVTGVEVRTGPMAGAIEIATAGHQGGFSGGYSANWAVNAYQQANALRASRGLVRKQQAFIEELRRLVAEAKAKA
jgi:hypothetical protein